MRTTTAGRECQAPVEIKDDGPRYFEPCGDPATLRFRRPSGDEYLSCATHAEWASTVMRWYGTEGVELPVAEVLT